MTLISISTSTFGQFKLNIDAVVLGLLRDRQIIKEDLDDRKKVVEFFFTEYEIMDFIDSLVTIGNNQRNQKERIKTFKKVTKDSDCEKCDKTYIFYSDLLAKTINKSSRLEFSKMWAEPNSKKIYLTEVKQSSIRTKDQQISFIIGAFLRFGTFNSGPTYTIKLYRAQSKFDLIETVLNKLDCQIIKKDIEQGTDIETDKIHLGMMTIEFKPSLTVESELLKLRPLKSKLADKRNAYLQRED